MPGTSHDEQVLPTTRSPWEAPVDHENMINPASGRPKRRRDWRSGPGGWLFVVPVLVLFAVFIAYPMLRNLQVSFYDWDGLTQAKHFIGWQNYAWLLGDRASRLSLRNVVVYGVVTVPVQMALGFLAAVGLRGRGVLRVTARTLVFLPVVLTPVVVGFLFSDILEPNNGVLNRVLRAVGLDMLARPWLGDTSLALFVVAAVNIWMWTGFGMAIYHAGLEAVPDEVVEAAVVDGASPARVIRHIYLPMMRHAHYALLTLGVIGTLKTFDLVYVLTRGGPDHATEVPATYLYSTAFSAYKQGRAAALGVVLVLVALLVTYVQLRLQRRGDRA